MRSLRTLLLLPLLWLSGCACLTRDLEPAASDPAVMLDVISQREQGAGFSVGVRFYEFDELPGLVQEVRLPGNRVCVEYFDTPGGAMALCQFDHHWAPAPEGVREMFVYPARIEGADLTELGFAMLPDNGQGLATNVAKNFNANYQSKREIRGRIVEARRSAGVVWRIWSGAQLHIEIPKRSRL